MRFVLALVACLGLCGCAQTSKVAETLDTGTLTRTHKAVALVKLGAPDPACRNVQVVVARREGAMFREVQTLRIAHLQGPDAAIAEAEFDPGEYHVVAYACATPRGQIALSSRKEPGLFAASMASFSLAPGEIVNVGFLRLVPVAVTRQMVSRTVHWQATVADWPLTDLDRFKQQRPHLFAAMKTRLMTVTRATPMTAEQKSEACARFKQLQTEGKVQSIPAECLPGAATTPRSPPTSPTNASTKKRIDA